MAYCGLMPDSRVSTALISACLREARYDFIQEYVQAIRQLYPFLDLGTNGPFAAWYFARAWKEIQATCEDVQKGCLAMAYCATSDPFGKTLRDVAEETVRLDICRCISTILSITTGNKPSEIFKSLRCLDFDKLIESAQDLVGNPGPQTKPYLQARDRLLDQIRAVTRLNKLFGGDHMGDRIEMSTQYKSAIKKRSRVKDAGDSGGFAERIFQERNILPEPEMLWKLIAMHYAHRQRQGLPTDHDLLQHLAVELMRLQRVVEAGQLMNAVHESPYAWGRSATPFGEELLHQWFHAGILLNSPKVMIQALWAFIDSAADVVVSTAFLIRVEAACDKLYKGLVARKRARNPKSFRLELEYLRATLRIRYWRQMGMEAADGRGLWNEYKTWDESTTSMPTEDKERTFWEESTQDTDQHSIEENAQAARAS